MNWIYKCKFFVWKIAVNKRDLGVFIKYSYRRRSCLTYKYKCSFITDMLPCNMGASTRSQSLPAQLIENSLLFVLYRSLLRIFDFIFTKTNVQKFLQQEIYQLETKNILYIYNITFVFINAQKFYKIMISKIKLKGSYYPVLSPPLLTRI